MCGRGTQKLTWAQIHHLAGILSRQGDAALGPNSNLEPNYNVAPTHDVIVCATRDGERQIEKMTWGLVPGWAKERPKFRTINAMCESIEEKATWKGSLNKMRCVVPFSGFYEWKGPKGNKQPYYVTRRDGEPLMLAGLWAYNDKIDPAGMRTFAIVTCDANAAVGQIHNRMPVVLSNEGVDIWLDGQSWSPRHKALLEPCPDDWLTAVPVKKDVGNVKNNREDLIEPVGPLLF